MGFYIPEGTILHSHRRENLKSYALATVSADRIVPITQHTRSKWTAERTANAGIRKLKLILEEWKETSRS
jgi:hypothetical protein